MYDAGRVGFMRHVAVYVVLTISLAGCFGNDSPKDARDGQVSPGTDTVDPSGWAYKLACPPGGTERTDGTCAGTIALADAGFQEPTIAVNRRNPDQMAIAANAHGGTASLQQGSVAPFGLVISRDGGETWAHVDVPQAPSFGIGDLPIQAADPAIAFDHEGNLHVNWIVFLKSSGELSRWVLYSSTPDLGETWVPLEDLSIPASAYPDRNWLHLTPDGEPIVTWRDGSVESIFVQWYRTEAWVSHEIRDCEGVGPAVTYRNQTLLGCRDTTTDEVLVHTLRPGESELLAAIGPAVSRVTLVAGPRLAAISHGRIEGMAPTMWLSDDARHWTPGVGIADRTALEDAWPVADLFAAAVDVAGNFHILLGGGGDLARAANCRVDHGFELVHLVLAASGLSPLFEHRIETESMDAATTGMQVHLPCNDDVYGMAVQRDSMVVVWHRTGQLDWTLVDSSATSDASQSASR